MKQNIFDVRKEPDFKLQNVDTKQYIFMLNKVFSYLSTNFNHYGVLNNVMSF